MVRCQLHIEGKSYTISLHCYLLTYFTNSDVHNYWEIVWNYSYLGSTSPTAPSSFFSSRQPHQRPPYPPVSFSWVSRET